MRIIMEKNLQKQLTQKFLSCVISAALCLAGLLYCAESAFADDADTKVAESARAYNEAISNQEKIANDIASLNSQIKEIENELPKQQAVCNESLCAMYKNSSDSMSIISALLKAKSITDVAALVDAYNWIYEYNESEVKKTVELRDKLEKSKSDLEDRKKEADEAATTAANNLEAASRRASKLRKRQQQLKRKKKLQRKNQALNHLHRKALKKLKRQQVLIMLTGIVTRKRSLKNGLRV